MITLQPPMMIQPVTTVTPSTTLSTTVSSLINRDRLLPVLTTPSTTTTTTQAPAASASGSAYYSGSGSASYSGSAYYSSSGLTAKASDQSGRLTRPANELTRSFKGKNGDIIIKWTPGGGKLKKIGV
jgi:hypothetical protein